MRRDQFRKSRVALTYWLLTETDVDSISKPESIHKDELEQKLELANNKPVKIPVQDT
jgi:hypothetical protein